MDLLSSSSTQPTQRQVKRGDVLALLDGMQLAKRLGIAPDTALELVLEHERNKSITK